MRGKTSLISACFVLCAAAGAVWGVEQNVTRKEYGYQIKFPVEMKVLDLGGGLTQARWFPNIYVWVRTHDLKEGDSICSFFEIPSYKDWLKTVTLEKLEEVKLDGRRAFKLTTLSDGYFR